MTLIRQTQGGESSIKTLIIPLFLSMLGLFLTLELAKTTGLLHVDTSQAASSGTTTRVSVATGGTQANYNSFEAAISADGRYVAFTSGANNLVGIDNNGVWDVFVRDRQTSQTTRVSAAPDGSEGDDNSNEPALSADGRYVAFSSVATNLVTTDNNGVADIFVHDRQTGQTVLVSIGSDGTQSNDASKKPSISSSGRFVAFDSAATNLVAGDSNIKTDVFVHDRDADVDGIYDVSGQVSTVRVSVSSGGTQGNGTSDAASISAGGQYVVFESTASNLVGSDGNGLQDIFLHDRASDGNGVYDQPGGKSTTLLSQAYDGTDANGASRHPAISADGGTVVFESFATNLIGGGTTQFIRHIFAYDVQTGRTTLVSIASDGSESNRWSQEADLSDDGRYVAFSSNADNLVTGDTNFITDIFLHDRDVDQDGYFDEPGQVSTVRVNVASDGSPTTNGQSYSPALSDNGQATAFESADSALVSDDANGVADIFVHDQFTPTSGADLSVTICCDRERDLKEKPYPAKILDDFVVSVTNAGPDAAHNVTLDFVVSPTEVITPSQGTCDPAPTKTCHIGTLATGATGTVLVVQYGSPVSPESLYQGSVAVGASATADENDPDPTNNRANASVHYYICKNAGCVLEDTICRLLLQDWPSDRAGSQGTADESTLSSGSGPSAVSLFSKLRAAADFIPHLPLYYDVRDEILATPDGQHLTNLYNTYGDEIFSLMENDQNLWDQGLYALEAWEPNLQALVDGQGSVTITALQVQAVDDFLTNLSAAGSPELQQTIADERTRLGDQDDFAGMTMDEARGDVVGYAVYLPLVLRDR